MTDNLMGRRYLPDYMLTCYYCMGKFPTPPEVTDHWEVCTARQHALAKPEHGLHHVSPRGVRNIVGEVVFSVEWKRLMETPPEHSGDNDYTRFDYIIDFIREPITQRHAGLAASFITWLGTNCGGSYLHQARKLVADNPFRSKSQMFLGQWAVENYRRPGVNSSGRTVEHLLYEGKHDAFGMTENFPIPSATDYEVLEHVVYWLGTHEGQDFLDRCEKLIVIRKRGLSDRDLTDLSLSIA